MNGAQEQQEGPAPHFPATPELWTLIQALHGAEALAAGKITLVAPAQKPAAAAGTFDLSRCGQDGGVWPVNSPENTKAGWQSLEGADLPAAILKEMRLQRDLLLGMNTKLEAVANVQGALRRENTELRQLNAAGHLNFAVRVNPEDFLAFAVTMALGNRKAAADHLKIPHRGFYNRVNLWARGSQDHQRMFRLIEWRKKTGRKIVVHLDDSVQSGEPNDEAENPVTVAAVLAGIAASDSRDYPAILREILEVLAMQNQNNWAKLGREAMEIIREEVGYPGRRSSDELTPGYYLSPRWGWGREKNVWCCARSHGPTSPRPSPHPVGRGRKLFGGYVTRGGARRTSLPRAIICRPVGAGGRTTGAWLPLRAATMASCGMRKRME